MLVRWIKYINRIAGFEIEYPNSYKFASHDKEVGFLLYPKRKGISPLAYRFVVYVGDELLKMSWYKEKPYKTEEKIIDNLKSNWMWFGRPNDDGVVEVRIEINNKNVQLICMATDLAEEMDIFYQLVKSFKVHEKG